MASNEDRLKHSRRRQTHIVKDLITPKYRERSVPGIRVEDDMERRFRRYGALDEVGDEEPDDDQAECAECGTVWDEMLIEEDGLCPMCH